MKKVFIFVCIVAIAIYFMSTYFFIPVQDPYIVDAISFQSEILRLHIRANSNSTTDQQTKYAVRDAILPIISNATEGAQTIEEATIYILAVKEEIEEVAKEISKTSASVEICVESFPTREYYGEILLAGEYTALVINLGEGEGDNWWCVAFPPLCYIDGEEIDGEEIVLKSKIAEIWDKYFQLCEK